MGLFTVASSWFIFTLYYFWKAIGGGITVAITDIPGSIGLGFRTSAALLAFTAMLFYISGKPLSIPEAVTTLRWILLLEAAYWLTLLPSGFWGLTFTGTKYKDIIFWGTGIPCLFEALVIPIALLTLFLKLGSSRNEEHKNWGMIAGAIYILAFWLNLTMQWISEILRSGLSFVTIHPANLVGFLSTAAGLLALAAYSFTLAGRSFKGMFENIKVKNVGLIITAFGLYFDLNLLLWLVFGSPGGWNIWHIFFIHHNADLWMASLPLIGIPLMRSEKFDALG